MTEANNNSMPEQLEPAAAGPSDGPADARPVEKVDMWAFGCVLYNMLHCRTQLEQKEIDKALKPHKVAAAFVKDVSAVFARDDRPVWATLKLLRETTTLLLLLLALDHGEWYWSTYRMCLIYISPVGTIKVMHKI